MAKVTGAGCLLFVIAAICVGVFQGVTGIQVLPRDTPGPTPVPHTIHVSQSTFVGNWPLTVTEGDIACETPTAVVFKSAGVTYAMNGVALSARSTHGWRRIDEIWADDPNYPGLKVDIGSMIDAGLALCG